MADAGLSLVEGSPLEEEAGQGAQTIAGYLREVVARHGASEALVLRSGDVRISWSYDELLEHSLAVARALVASGAGRGQRVGILMTNRPEFVSSLFGIALAGGVPTLGQCNHGGNNHARPALDRHGCKCATTRATHARLRNARPPAEIGATCGRLVPGSPGVAHAWAPALGRRACL